MSPSVALGVKNGSENHTVTAGKGSNMQKMPENKISSEELGAIYLIRIHKTHEKKKFNIDYIHVHASYGQLEHVCPKFDSYS